MKLLKLVTIMLACQVLAWNGLAQTTELDSMVDKIMKSGKVVGGSVVVYMKGEMVYARDYGFRNLSRKLPVDEHTYFKLASITKMVSGVGLMLLHEKNQVDLDDDISEYFGVTIRNPRFPDTPLTLRQLMSHTSSITDTGGFSKIKSRVTDMLAFENKRQGNFLGHQPGAKYYYSNFGAGLVGAVMESVTGKSVNTYVAQAVFAPLGIDAAYSAGLVKNAENVATLYKDGKLYKAASRYIAEGYEDTANPDAHYRTTVGSLWMRSRDLAKLTSLLCEGGELEGTRLLQETSVNEMMENQMSLGKSVVGPSSYGLHIERQDTIIPGVVLYGHQGTGDGMIVNSYFEPDSGFVITILTNGNSMAKRNRVGVMARKLITELYPRFVQND